MWRLSVRTCCRDIVIPYCASVVRSRFLALMAVVVWVCGADAQPPNPVPEDIAPPDVYVRALLVQDELELIRLEMGKPKDTRRALQVAEAEPREVFFQALTLFHKTNRLSFNLTREHAELPEKPVGTLRSAHVMAVVSTVLTQLERVKAHLGTIEPSREQPRDPMVTTSDVFSALVQANRQANLLLDRQIAPSDGFQQVTLAVGYTAQLRTHFPGTRMPEPPPFERRKRPTDVYDRLIACFDRVRTIMSLSGFSALTMDRHPQTVTPNDVYDLAALVVSELSFLHAQLDGVPPPPMPYNSGRKLPADVYQRARLLETLLIDLQARVQASPSWLQAQDERE